MTDLSSRKRKRLFIKDPEIKASHIDVDVDHGNVTLKGVARSDREKQKIVETAWA